MQEMKIWRTVKMEKKMNNLLMTYLQKMEMSRLEILNPRERINATMKKIQETRRINHFTRDDSETISGEDKLLTEEEFIKRLNSIDFAKIQVKGHSLKDLQERQQA